MGAGAGGLAGPGNLHGVPLEVLAGAGLVVESRIGEGLRIFEARSAPHPHLLCEECGRISHLDSAAGGRILDALEAEVEGFQTRELHVFATGVCAERLAAPSD